MKLILISSLINNIKLILNKKFEIQLMQIIYSISIFPSGKIISISSDKSIKIFNINYNLIHNIINVHKLYYL